MSNHKHVRVFDYLRGRDSSQVTSSATRDGRRDAHYAKCVFVPNRIAVRKNTDFLVPNQLQAPRDPSPSPPTGRSHYNNHHGNMLRRR